MFTPRLRLALLGAAGCLAALVLAWIATFSPAGRWLDQAALQGFSGLRRPRVAPLAVSIAHLGDPLPFALCGLALVAIALLRGRRRVALVVPVVLLGANVTTQVLKPLLPDDRTAAALAAGANIRAGSWPSGHATAAMALALALVMVVPARLRPAAAILGAGFTIAVSYSFLALGWHFPSDVVAGYSVAALWTALGVAALWAHPPQGAGRADAPVAVDWSEALAPALVAVVLCVAVGSLVFLSHPYQVVGYARAHTTFVVAAAAIAGLGVAIATGLALVFRRAETPDPRASRRAGRAQGAAPGGRYRT